MTLDPLSRIIFQPELYPSGHWPMQESCGAQDVSIITADGVRIHGWWFSVEGSSFATLFLHGSAGNLTDWIDHAKAITQAGSSVLMIDYRGYGKSEGRPSRKGVLLDGDAGYSWLQQFGFRPSLTVLHGKSLGTAVVTALASRRTCGALVLESPFASLSAMADVVAPFVGRVLVHGFNIRTLVKKNLGTQTDYSRRG